MKKQFTVYPFDKLRAGSLQSTEKQIERVASLAMSYELWTMDSLTGGKSS